MATNSTEAIYALLRTHLLAFEGPSGASLADRFADRLYIVRAPDDTAYPYGTLRLMPRISQARYNGDAEVTQLEVLLYDRPERNATTLEADADIVDQSMLRFVDSGPGLLFSRERQRDTLPVAPPNMQRDIVAIRFLFHLEIWPTLFTDYATS